MTTDERIENLEKGLASARRLNRWLLAAVGLAISVWILAGTFGPATAAAPAAGGAVKEVRANRFIVEDAKGKVRATLDVDVDGPWLRLFDENGKTHAELAGTKDRPRLYLVDENAKPRVMLATTKDNSELHLLDENGTIRAMLATIKGAPGLALFDENGKPRAGLALDVDGPGLNLYDAAGGLVWSTAKATPSPASAVPSKGGQMAPAPPGPVAPAPAEPRQCATCNGTGVLGQCPYCEGTGHELLSQWPDQGYKPAAARMSPKKCTWCGGTGMKPCFRCGGKGVFPPEPASIQCPKCKGTGTIGSAGAGQKPCYYCEGTGKVTLPPLPGQPRR
ncbi:MAG: hypothetical protein IMZ44_11135 [Planctomycetes bacterium]|nr:hypothetical protein [Planctomycetota bacterium]